MEKQQQLFGDASRRFLARAMTQDTSSSGGSDTPSHTRLAQGYFSRGFGFVVSAACLPIVLYTQSRYIAKEHRLLPQFLDEIQPGGNVRNTVGCAAMIRSVPYSTVKTHDNVMLTPDFTMRVRKGGLAEHALLHASILQGLRKMMDDSGDTISPFVCMGTNWKKEPHIWVATFEWPGKDPIDPWVQQRSAEERRDTNCVFQNSTALGHWHTLLT